MLKYIPNIIDSGNAKKIKIPKRMPEAMLSLRGGKNISPGKISGVDIINHVPVISKTVRSSTKKMMLKISHKSTHDIAKNTLINNTPTAIILYFIPCVF